MSQDYKPQFNLHDTNDQYDIHSPHCVLILTTGVILLLFFLTSHVFSLQNNMIHWKRCCNQKGVWNAKNFSLAKQECVFGLDGSAAGTK